MDDLTRHASDELNTVVYWTVGLAVAVRVASQIQLECAL